MPTLEWIGKSKVVNHHLDVPYCVWKENTVMMASFHNTKGIEMEAYGVAYAAAHAADPKPFVIIAKSVCDFADERKDDSYQKFAAYTSCGFVKDLLEKVLDYHGE